MHSTTAIPAVWVYTTNAGYGALRTGGYGAFLSRPQAARLERIRQAGMLFRGEHRRYFLDEGRTQFQFPETRAADGQVRRLYVPFNVLRLVSMKTADVLFGQDPLIRAEDEIQQAHLSRLIDSSSLYELLRRSAVECSWAGSAFIEATARDGQVRLQRIPAGEIFPAGQLGPDGQYERYVRYALKNAGTEEKPIWLLLETWYIPGAITRTLWQLDDAGQKARELELSQWTESTSSQSALLRASVSPCLASEPALAPVTQTNIVHNTITWLPNELVDDESVSDYDGLVELQDELNSKQTQIARVLEQHSDPAMAFPEECFDEQGNIRQDHKVFPYAEAGKVPQYIVWNAQLDAAIKDRAFVLGGLLILAEMSPSLLGLREGAAPEAWKKLRLEASNTLAMARRKAGLWKGRIRRALQVAQELEQTLPGVRYPIGPIAVEMRDGIPVDELEQAQTIEVYRRAGVMSVRRAVEVQLQDPAAVAKEVRELTG